MKFIWALLEHHLVGQAKAKEGAPAVPGSYLIFPCLAVHAADRCPEASC